MCVSQTKKNIGQGQTQKTNRYAYQNASRWERCLIDRKPILETRSNCRSKNETSAWQKTKRRVKQGVVMSLDLLNLYSEIIMRKISHLQDVSVDGKKTLIT